MGIKSDAYFGRRNLSKEAQREIRRELRMAVMAAYKRKDLNLSDKATLLALADFQGTNLFARPSVETIGETIGVNERTVRRSLRRLAELELISGYVQAPAGRNDPSCYTVRTGAGITPPQGGHYAPPRRAICPQGAGITPDDPSIDPATEPATQPPIEAAATHGFLVSEEEEEAIRQEQASFAPQPNSEVSAIKEDQDSQTPRVPPAPPQCSEADNNSPDAVKAALAAAGVKPGKEADAVAAMSDITAEMIRQAARHADEDPDARSRSGYLLSLLKRPDFRADPSANPFRPSSPYGRCRPKNKFDRKTAFVIKSADYFAKFDRQRPDRQDDAEESVSWTPPAADDPIPF